MTLPEPAESKWAPWFWLGVIVLALGSIVAVAVFLVYALWRGM